MNRILYCTNENTDVNYGKIYHNELEVLPPNSEEFNNYFELLYSNIKDDNIVGRNDFMIVRKFHNGYLLQGNLENEDNLGRKIGFLYLCNGNDINMIKNYFYTDLSKHNYKIDKNFIFPKEKKTKQLIISIISTILLIIVAIYFLSRI